MMNQGQVPSYTGRIQMRRSRKENSLRATHTGGSDCPENSRTSHMAKHKGVRFWSALSLLRIFVALLLLLSIVNATGEDQVVYTMRLRMKKKTLNPLNQNFKQKKVQVYRREQDLYFRFKKTWGFIYQFRVKNVSLQQSTKLNRVILELERFESNLMTGSPPPRYLKLNRNGWKFLLLCKKLNVPSDNNWLQNMSVDAIEKKMNADGFTLRMRKDSRWFKLGFKGRYNTKKVDVVYTEQGHLTNRFRFRKTWGLKFEFELSDVMKYNEAENRALLRISRKTNTALTGENRWLHLNNGGMDFLKYCKKRGVLHNMGYRLTQRLTHHTDIILASMEELRQIEQNQSARSKKIDDMDNTINGIKTIGEDIQKKATTQEQLLRELEKGNSVRHDANIQTQTRMLRDLEKHNSFKDDEKSMESNMPVVTYLTEDAKQHLGINYKGLMTRGQNVHFGDIDVYTVMRDAYTPFTVKKGGIVAATGGIAYLFTGMRTGVKCDGKLTAGITDGTTESPTFDTTIEDMIKQLDEVTLISLDVVSPKTEKKIQHIWVTTKDKLSESAKSVIAALKKKSKVDTVVHYDALDEFRSEIQKWFVSWCENKEDIKNVKCEVIREAQDVDKKPIKMSWTPGKMKQLQTDCGRKCVLMFDNGGMTFKVTKPDGTQIISGSYDKEGFEKIDNITADKFKVHTVKTVEQGRLKQNKQSAKIQTMEHVFAHVKKHIEKMNKGSNSTQYGMQNVAVGYTGTWRNKSEGKEKIKAAFSKIFEDSGIEKDWIMDVRNADEATYMGYLMNDFIEGYASKLNLKFTDKVCCEVSSSSGQFCYFDDKDGVAESMKPGMKAVFAEINNTTTGGAKKRSKEMPKKLPKPQHISPMKPLENGAQKQKNLAVPPPSPQKKVKSKSSSEAPQVPAIVGTPKTNNIPEPPLLSSSTVTNSSLKSKEAASPTSPSKPGNKLKLDSTGSTNTVDRRRRLAELEDLLELCRENGYDQ